MIRRLSFARKFFKKKRLMKTYGCKLKQSRAQYTVVLKKTMCSLTEADQLIYIRQSWIHALDNRTSHRQGINLAFSRRNLQKRKQKNG